jgi:hypothetical protein
LTANAKRARLQSQTASISGTRFGYFNSFLYLTFNPIMKYHQNSSSNKSSNNGGTSSSYSSYSSKYRKMAGILRNKKDTNTEQLHGSSSSLSSYRKRAFTTTSVKLGPNSVDQSDPVDFTSNLKHSTQIDDESQAAAGPGQRMGRRRHSLCGGLNESSSESARRQRAFSTEQWLYNQDRKNSAQNNVTILTGKHIILERNKVFLQF